jgi:hypothetical protein
MLCDDELVLNIGTRSCTEADRQNPIFCENTHSNKGGGRRGGLFEKDGIVDCYYQMCRRGRREEEMERTKKEELGRFSKKRVG